MNNSCHHLRKIAESIYDDTPLLLNYQSEGTYSLAGLLCLKERWKFFSLFRANHIYCDNLISDGGSK